MTNPSAHHTPQRDAEGAVARPRGAALLLRLFTVPKRNPEEQNT